MILKNNYVTVYCTVIKDKEVIINDDIMLSANNSLLTGVISELAEKMYGENPLKEGTFFSEFPYFKFCNRGYNVWHINLHTLNYASSIMEDGDEIVFYNIKK